MDILFPIWKDIVEGSATLVHPVWKIEGKEVHPVWKIEEKIEVEDVKEAVKELKEEFPINCKEHHKFHNAIDAKFGEKLI